MSLVIFADDSGVFRAKNSDKHSKGAKEVEETRDTHVDVPLDDQQAEEVQVFMTSHIPFSRHTIHYKKVFNSLKTSSKIYVIHAINHRSLSKQLK